MHKKIFNTCFLKNNDVANKTYSTLKFIFLITIYIFIRGSSLFLKGAVTFSHYLKKKIHICYFGAPCYLAPHLSFYPWAQADIIKNVNNVLFL